MLGMWSLAGKGRSLGEGLWWLHSKHWFPSTLCFLAWIAPVWIVLASWFCCCVWMKPLCHASQLQQTELYKHERKQIMKVSISYFDPIDVKSDKCNHIKHIILFCNSRNKQAHCSLMSAGGIHNKHLLISNLEFWTPHIQGNTKPTC